MKLAEPQNASSTLIEKRPKSVAYVFQRRAILLVDPRWPYGPSAYMSDVSKAVIMIHHCVWEFLVRQSGRHEVANKWGEASNAERCPEGVKQGADHIASGTEAWPLHLLHMTHPESES